MAIESHGQDSRTPAPAAAESRWQRLLALVLTGTLGIGAIVAFILTPSLITDFRAEARFFESPAFVPRLALSLVVACAVAHLFRVARGASLDAGEELDDENANRRVVLFGIALFAAYVLLVPLIGYVPSTIAFAVAAGGLASIGLRRSLVLAVLLGACVFVVFVLLFKVWFPAPSLLGVLG